MTVEFHTLTGGENDLHFAMEGTQGRTVILCLHGFPEYWAAWEDVMPLLAKRFCVVVPDQRGYNLSSRPVSQEAYAVRHLVNDIQRLADHVSPDRPIILAGHDWGASVAYAYAFRHPQRLAALIVANGVHPVCFQRAIVDDEAQRAASQYINVLRADDAAPRMLANGCARTFRMIEGYSQTGWMNKQKRQAYLDAWSRPGAMDAMLNWYRASSIVVPAPGAKPGPIPVLDMDSRSLMVKTPHLVLWGERDQALLPVCLQGLAGFAPDLSLCGNETSGHWILHENPEFVANRIESFAAEKEIA